MVLNAISLNQTKVIEIGGFLFGHKKNKNVINMRDFYFSRKRKAILLGMLFLVSIWGNSHAFASAGTVLTPGDIVVLNVATGGNDDFSVMPLVDLEGGY